MYISISLYLYISINEILDCFVVMLLLLSTTAGANTDKIFVRQLKISFGCDIIFIILF